MKNYLLIVFLLLAGSFYLLNPWSGNKFGIPPSNQTTQVSPSSNQNVPAIEGVFEGVTPCSNVAKPLPQIQSNTNCEMTIWQVTFNPDSTYTLISSYGMTQPNTPGIRGGGTKINMRGNWTQAQGTKTNPNATVIQLNTENPQTSVSFMKITDDLIHLLEADKNMMVGNAGWSYTLSKTSSRGQVNTPSGSISPGQAIGKPTSGVFEGRTLCPDFLAEFTKRSAKPPSSCDRIKWRLTFYKDSETGQPTRFVFGVVGRLDSHGGSWDILKGTKSDPNAIIYQLKPDNSEQILSLLKIDDNHLFFLDQNMNLLVGDALWSYTLSRTN